MKKYFYLAAAAITLVACNQKEMENDGVQEPKVINLTASINSGEDVTRAKSTDALQDETFVVGKTIFVEAYEKNQTTAYTSGNYTTAAAGALTGSLYYPGNNNNVDICAYYPSSISSGSTAFSVQADQSSEANYQASDLMYATKLTNKASGETHNLTFNHALTKIVVNVSYAANMITTGLTTSPAITDVKINGTVQAAQLSNTNGVITASKATATEPAAITIMGTGMDNMGIIVPQEVAAGTFITLTYNSVPYTYSLPAATTFQAGKVYTYALTLSARGLELSATTITNWTVETGEGANTGDSAGITI